MQYKEIKNDINTKHQEELNLKVMKAEKNKYILKKALGQSQKLLKSLIKRVNDVDIDDLSNEEKESIKHFLLGLNIGCGCDYYYGYDCGCENRSFLSKEGIKELKI